MLDGYIITETAHEALNALDKPGVRHVATLANGEGFVAFDGERPCAGTLLITDDEVTVPDVRKIRRRGPVFGETEAFYLLPKPLTPLPTFYDMCRQLCNANAMTVLHTGNVLIQTDGTPVPGALWGAVATYWEDARVLV